MPTIRVTAQGPTARLGTALLPAPAGDARAWQSRGQVNGNPGVAAVPAPAPGAVPQSWNRALHRSSDAPDAWRPSVYFVVRGGEERPPVSYVSDNQMPVPAIPSNGRPAVLQQAPRFLGQKQIGWPVAAQMYPWARG